MSEAGGTEPAAQKSAKAVRRRGARRLQTALAGLVALVVVLTLGVRFGVQIPQVLQVIERGVDGLKIGRFGRLQVSGVQGDLWRDLAVQRLAIADDKGVWLEAKALRLVWRPADLLRRSFHAERLTAAELRVLRRPVLGPKKPSRGMPVSVRIDALRARVELDPAFSYRRGLYGVTANLDIRRRNGGQRGAVAAKSLLHDGDHLDLRFDIGERRPLAVSARAQEAEGGALAGALGLPANQAFRLSVGASGRTSAGRFEARATSGSTVPLDARGAWGPGGGEADGRVSLAASRLTRDLAERFGATVTFRVYGRKTPGGLYALDGRAASDNLTINMRGQGDLGKRRTGPAGVTVDVRSPDLSKPSRIAGLGGARISGVLRGDARDLQFAGRAEVSGVQRQGYALQSVRGPIEFRRRRGDLTLKADLAGAGGQGQGLLAALLGATPRLKMEGARLGDGRLLLRELEAAGAGLTVEASGGRSLLGGLTFKGEASASNLAAWRPQAAGGLTATWSAGQSGAGRPWAFELDARGEGFATGMAELDRLLGATPDLRARAELEGRAVRVSEARLAGATLKAQTSGAIGDDGGLDFKLDWSATGPFRAGPVEITGQAAGKGVLSGSIAEPIARLDADVDAIDIPRLPLKDAHITLTFVRRPDGSSGEAALTADSAYGRAAAQSAFRFPEGGVDLTDLSVDAGGLEASGRLSLRRRTPSAADLRVVVTRGAFLDNGRVSGAVRIVDTPGGPRANLDLTAKDALFKGAKLAIGDGRISADGALSKLPYTVEAAGVSGGGRWRVSGGGAFVSSAPGYELTFDGEGRLGRHDLRTSETARLSFGGGARAARLRLMAGERGRIDLDARLAQSEAEVNARVADVDMGLFNEDLAGQVEATLALNGRGGPLAGSLDARLTGARGRGADPASGIDGAVTARLDGSSLSLHGESANRQGLKANADLVLPAVSSTSPFRLAIDRRKPIQGRYYADGEIRPLWELLMDSDRTLSGHVSAEGRIGGSLADPEPQGQATLANGRFEDGATGLVLQDLRLAARFAGDMIDVTDAVGADGKGGNINGGGRINLARDGDSSFLLDLKNFRVIDNDQASATATGKVTVDRKSDGKMRLAGALTINEAQIAADPPTPSGVVTMEVVERNKPVDLQASLVAPARSGPGIALDVALKAPRRVFLRGRGLDMEFSLDAHVGGTTSRPVLEGTARVVRGDYDFAGKRFEFDPRGVVYLATTARAIRLDLTATRADASLVAVVRVSGTAAKPTITLTSTPVLPNDEVLSQVLFGVSASQLSPLEAAQLASALSSLAGGGGFDVIGGLRTFAGLDRLALVGGGENAVSVSGGKYLTEDVYLEITGGGREGGAAQVEWRVRPNLSIISRIVGQGDAKLAIRWRRDY